MGRPVEPVPQDIADKVVDWISEGKTLRDFCRQDGMPSFSAIYAWQKKDPEFAERIACARESGHDQIAEQCVTIADNEDGDPNRDKLRVWTRLQLLAKWNPRKYGDRTTLAGDPEAPIQANIAVTFVRPPQI